MKFQEINTLVIGAGQSGLAIGYYLKSKTSSFLLVDQNQRVGDSWRKRYDSLVLFTPRAYSALPGLPFPGPEDGYPTKDEVANYLETYAKHFDLPVLLGTRVEQLTRIEQGFLVQTNRQIFLAQNVVIATGPFQMPNIPDFSAGISEDVFQIHSTQYRNPFQLKDGSVLIVGAGNSGVQIATELAQEREVILSVGKPMKILPHKILNKSIFWWFDTLGISKVTIESKLGQWMSQRDPIIGKESVPFIKKGMIQIRPRAIHAQGNKVIFADQSDCEVNNIIWATGFHADYSWIKIQGVIDPNSRPIHKRGVTSVPGLYFIGLSWQWTRGSALLMGVGKDAKYLSEIMSFKK